MSSLSQMNKKSRHPFKKLEKYSSKSGGIKILILTCRQQIFDEIMISQKKKKYIYIYIYTYIAR